jgi:2',3'-cyclic-nucleotide 2'-phosphodiesterase (5'-nucleotidase family)
MLTSHSTRTLRVLAPAFLTVTLPAGARAAPDNPVIIYHADLEGRLASPRCGHGRETPIDYAAVVGAIRIERERAPVADRLPPVVLLGGNQTAPGLFARSLLDGGDAGTRRLATLLARGSYDAVALGHQELSLAPAELFAFVRAATTAGLPVVTTNLRCSVARQALCSMTQPDLLVRRGTRVFGILATISPGVLPGIPPDRRQGLVLEDPASAVRAAVGRLRARGATHVVLMTQQNRSSRSLDETDALARALGTDGAPDLILAGGLSEEPDVAAVRLIARESMVPIAGSSTGTTGLTRVTLPEADGSLPSAAFVSTGAVAGDAETERLLTAEIGAYCARFGVPVAAGPIRGTLTRDSFLSYVLEVMRRRAGAEIAVINQGFVKRAPFPMQGALTRADLYTALPYRAAIGVARMTGVSVEKVLGPVSGSAGLAISGLTGSGGKLSVNGRTLDKTRSYRVATIEFVATGGDNLVAAGSIPWRALPGAVDLRDAVESFLRAETGTEDRDASIDLKTDFGPPAEARPLLVGVTDVGFDLLDTSISNGPRYGDAQLTRSAQTSLKGEITALAQLRMPAHQADARFNLKYGWTRSQPAGAPAISGETADLVTLTSIYGYGGLKKLTREPRSLIPDPYARVWLESELTRPDVTPTQTRAFHHFELTGTTGALFTLASKLKLRAGVGARSELMAPGTAGRWRTLFEAGAALDPVALGSLAGVVSRFEGLADYTFVEPGGTREHQLRASARLSVPIVPLLFLTAGIDVFAVEREAIGWGVSYDTTVGLRIHLDAAHQAL